MSLIALWPATVEHHEQGDGLWIASQPISFMWFVLILFLWGLVFCPAGLQGDFAGYDGFSEELGAACR